MRIGEGLGTCLPNHLGVVVYTCLCLSLWRGEGRVCGKEYPESLCSEGSYWAI